MAVKATRTLMKRLRRKIYLCKFTAPSVVAGGTSDLMLFQLNDQGKIVEVAVSCSSTSFDISLRDSATASEYTTKELLKVEGIDRSYRRVDWDLVFHNNDSPQTA